jgi:hypothetical protein
MNHLSRNVRPRTGCPIGPLAQDPHRDRGAACQLTPASRAALAGARSGSGAVSSPNQADELIGVSGHGRGSGSARRGGRRVVVTVPFESERGSTMAGAYPVACPKQPGASLERLSWSGIWSRDHPGNVFNGPEATSTGVPDRRLLLFAQFRAALCGRPAGDKPLYGWSRGQVAYSGNFASVLCSCERTMAGSRVSLRPVASNGEANQSMAEASYRSHRRLKPANRCRDFGRGSYLS